MTPDVESTPGLSPHEEARLTSLAGYHILDTLPEPAFSRLAALTAHVFQVPIATVSFVDGHRQWIKAGCGVDTTELPRGTALCSVAIETGRTQVVPDTLDTGTWHRHPLVTGAPHVRFYASAPLLAPGGHAIGALCIAGPRPRPALGPDEQRRLEDLAAMVMDELELRRVAAELEREHAALNQMAGDLRTALDHANILRAVTALADLDLHPFETALRITELTAAGVDADWGGLVVMQGDRALTFGAWHRPEADGFARSVAGGTHRQAGGLMWQALASGRPLFLSGYGGSEFAHPAAVALGVQAVADAPLGSIDGSEYIMSFVRLRRAAEWRRDDRALIQSVAQAATGTLRRMAAQTALATTQARLRLTVDSGPLVLWATDLSGQITLSDGRGLRALGIEQGATVGHNVYDLYAGHPVIIDATQRTMAGETLTTDIEVGGRIFEAHYTPLHGETDRQGGMAGVAYDVTERVMAERAARRAQAQAEALVALSHVLDAAAPFAEVAQRALDILQPTLGQGGLILWEQRGDMFLPLALAGEVSALRDQQRRGVPAARLRHLGVTRGRAAFLDAGVLPAWVQQAGVQAVALLPVLLEAQGRPLVLGAWAGEDDDSIRTPQGRAVLGAAARMLAAGALQRQRVRALEGFALTDPLTSLGNRRAFEAAFAAQLQAAQAAGRALAVVTLDVDGLKAANDRRGHAHGDRLLQTFAASLRAALPQDGLAFRLAGDEFMALLPGASAPDLEARLRGAVAGARTAGFPDMDVSMGVAWCPDDGMDPELLLALSDQRMYETKVGR